jgi:antitoxin ParD1/3/4
MIISYLKRSIVMPAIAKRTISLPAEQSAFLDAQLAKGNYASASEIVRAGLRALQDQEMAVEKWLHQEVAATYDAMKANPDRTITADDVLASLRERHKHRLAQGKQQTQKQPL